jgi:hypothetical protein
MTAQHISGHIAVKDAESRGGVIDDKAQSTENLDHKVRCMPTDGLRRLREKKYKHRWGAVVGTQPVEESVCQLEASVGCQRERPETIQNPI